MYLDFVVNLVDVRDVASGLLLVMERGRNGHRYILGGEDISLKKAPGYSGNNQWPQGGAHSDPC